MLVEQRSSSLLLKKMLRIRKKSYSRLATIYLEQERYEDILDLQSESQKISWPGGWLLVLTRNGRFGYCLWTLQRVGRNLKDNPEFLEHYIYLLRELGYFEEAKVNAQAYLKIVPDDVQMQELFESL